MILTGFALWLASHGTKDRTVLDGEVGHVEPAQGLARCVEVASVKLRRLDLFAMVEKAVAWAARGGQHDTAKFAEA